MILSGLVNSNNVIDNQANGFASDSGNNLENYSDISVVKNLLQAHLNVLIRSLIETNDRNITESIFKDHPHNQESNPIILLSLENLPDVVNLRNQLIWLESRLAWCFFTPVISL